MIPGVEPRVTVVVALALVGEGGEELIDACAVADTIVGSATELATALVELALSGRDVGRAVMSWSSFKSVVIVGSASGTRSKKG